MAQMPASVFNQPVSNLLGKIETASVFAHRSIKNLVTQVECTLSSLDGMPAELKTL